MTETSALEKMLGHDRLIVAVGLAVAVALAWAYLVAGAGIDMSMVGMPMEPMPWSTFYAVLMFTMWLVMMIAMMVPSASPMVLLFTAIKRKQEALVRPSAWLFVGGYLLIWAAFSLIAALAQWGLERAGLLSVAMMSTNAMFGGVILLAAGLYQFTPVKNACLRYCQSPVLFLSRHWRRGAMGALRMGLRHGGYCLGCCWFLMALLFVGGVMNLVWIAAIALYVACEKLLPLGHRLSRVAGVGLVVSGAIILARAA